jgi:hypothetical protein
MDDDLDHSSKSNLDIHLKEQIVLGIYMNTCLPKIILTLL